MLTEIALMCTKERCIDISFMVLNIFFSAFGVALFTGSSIVCYDHSMADRYLDYSSFRIALESANVSVHTPSSLNIGETLDVVCIVFIVIGVLFLLLGIMGIICAIFRLKPLLITYAVVLLVLVVLELICVLLVTTLRGKLEGFIKDTLEDSIRNNYTGITGNDTDTLRWNFIMHSFQCCGVDRYTDFRVLPAKNWNTQIETGGIVTGKQIPYACCKVKNDATCVLRPNNTTAFTEKGCYQVMRNWVTRNTGVMVGVGVIILVTEFENISNPSNMEKIESQKGKAIILVEGYRYRKDRANADGSTTWRCCKKDGCRGRMKMLNDVVLSSSEHNHAPDPAKNEAVV